MRSPHPFSSLHPFTPSPSSLPSSLHPPSLIPTFILHLPPLIPTLIPSSSFPHPYPHPFILLPSSLLSSLHPPSLIPTFIPSSSSPHPYPHPFIPHPYPHPFILLPSSLLSSLHPPSLIPAPQPTIISCCLRCLNEWMVTSPGGASCFSRSTSCTVSGWHQKSLHAWTCSSRTQKIEDEWPAHNEGEDANRIKLSMQEYCLRKTHAAKCTLHEVCWSNHMAEIIRIFI